MSVGCNRSVNGIIRNLYGKKIDFNWTKQTIWSDTLLDVYNWELDQTLKIVVYIDSTMCESCLYSYLSASSQFMDKVSSDSVVYICVLQNRPMAQIQKFLLTSNISNVIVTVDIENKYLRKNNIDKYTNIITSFLLDTNNRIVLVGDPLRSNILKKMYEDKIHQIINNNSM